MLFISFGDEAGMQANRSLQPTCASFAGWSAELKRYVSRGGVGLKSVLAGAVLLWLVGCASTYSPPTNAPSATMTLDLRSDSKGTTMQGYGVFAYKDMNCTPSPLGALMESKQFTGAVERMGPLKVAASSPLTFAVLYGESRMAQNRQCSFTASFLPRAGESYGVQFVVEDGALACGMKIVDGAGQEVRFESPLSSCAETFAGRVKNGGSGLLNWTFR